MAVQVHDITAHTVEKAVERTHLETGTVRPFLGYEARTRAPGALAEQRVAIAREAGTAPAALLDGLRERNRRRHGIDTPQESREVAGRGPVLVREAVEPGLLIVGEIVARQNMFLESDQPATLYLDLFVGLEDQRQHGADEGSLALLDDHPGIEIGRQGLDEEARNTRVATANLAQGIAGPVKQLVQAIGRRDIEHVVVDIGDLRSRCLEVDLRQRNPVEGRAGRPVHRGTGHNATDRGSGDNRDRESSALVFPKLRNNAPHSDTLPHVAAGQGRINFYAYSNCSASRDLVPVRHAHPLFFDNRR